MPDHDQNKSDDAEAIDAVTADIKLLNELIPGYQIEEKIAQGGQAVVFRAVQESNGREVALKIMMRGLFSLGAKQTKRMEREVSALSCLKHPNIVEIYDNGRVHGMPWFVMELVEGYNLIQYAQLHTIDRKVLVEKFVQVASAVGHAHFMGIVHRDLKPSNILVDVEGKPHIVDFGLVTDAMDDDSSQATATSEIVGTLPYSSPEQLITKRLDARSDVYSLGVLLYEFLTGEYPYPVDVPRVDLMRNIMSADPKKSPALPRDLWAVILKAMAKDKQERYETAVELAADLERWLKGEAVTARAHSSLYVLKKKLWRHKSRVAIGLLIAVVLSLGAGMWASSWHRDQLSRAAVIALEAGGHLHLANVHRDAGRTGLAMQSFDDVLEITSMAETDNPVILSIRYRALHRKGWQYYADGDLVSGNRCAEEAVQLAERMSREHPSDLKWKKHLAFSHILRGREHAAKEDWKSALVQFHKAYSALMKFADNAPVKKDVAFSLRWIGRCRYYLENHDAALTAFTESKQVSDELSGSTLASAEYILDSARCSYWIARCLVNRKTWKRPAKAISILEDTLKSIRGIEVDGGLLQDLTRIDKQICNYLEWVRKNYGSPASSSVSAGSSSSSSSGLGSPTMWKR